MHKTKSFFADSPVGRLKISLSGGKLYSVKLLPEPPLPEPPLPEPPPQQSRPSRFGPPKNSFPKKPFSSLPLCNPPTARNKGESLVQAALEQPSLESPLFAEAPPVAKAFFAAPRAQLKRQRKQRRQRAPRQAPGRIPRDFSAAKTVRNNRFLKSLPLCDRGTAFQKAVWREIQKIPFGKTETYQEIACKIGKPKAARAVGQACAANPFLLAVPCHRVTASGGRLGGFALGLKAKKALLAAER